MDHQAQGLEYVDGEWVSRPLDVYRLMARAQQQEDIVMQDPELQPQHSTTRFGILSRTVLPSPYVKSILPANIRQRKFNDVVFVGEDSIHLKEARPNEPLRHVASKSDFKGRILAARVFGSPRKAEVKAEHGTPIRRKDVHAQRRSTVGEETDLLPPEVIALALDTRVLMFLWAQQTQAGSVRFRHKTLRLPAGNSPFDRLGSFLAVDPKCRAMAVAALEGHFILYKTRDMDGWRDEMRCGRDSVPIEDERLIPLHGRVMHMEFLSPGDGQDDSHVVLLFVIAHGGRTKITCYDWDARYALSTVTARAERVNVDPEDHNPSLLIPLRRGPDFLLVFDQHISTYKNILAGTTSARYKTPLQKDVLTLLRPGDSKTYPRWVQWDRVARNDGFPKEALYIAREDGRVLYAEVGPSALPEASDAGQLPNPIDRGFASLDVDAGTLNRLQPDVLVAAGVASDGCLSKVGSWVCEGHNLPYIANNTFAFVESIPNWAPIADLEVTRLGGIRSPYERERDSIFITNGRAPHGAITELRRGLKASIDDYSGGMKGCTGLSIIDHGSEKTLTQSRQGNRYYAVLLINMPPESLIFRVTRVDESWLMEQVTAEGENSQDAILRDETISASMLLDRFTVQITRGKARVLQRPGLAHVDTVDFPDSILAAATNSDICHIAVAYREKSCTFLQAIEVSQDGLFGSKLFYELPCDPTCMELIDIRDEPHIFVGTTDSTVHVIRITPSTLDLVCQYSLMTPSTLNAMPTVCESAVLLSFRDEQLLLCGTRNGILVSLLLSSSESGLSFHPKDRVRMGTTAVRLRRSTTVSSMAFVSCGNDFCRVRYDGRDAVSTVINSIWFTDFANDDYQQHTVTAVDQLPLSQNSDDSAGDLVGFIFAISGDRLLLARLDHECHSDSPTLEMSKTVPRKLLTKATPSKLFYTENLRKLIVATTEPKQERAPPDGYRIIQSAIGLVRIGEDEPEIKQEDNLETPKADCIVAEYALKNYERVHALLEWVISDHKGRRHHFIYVGTGVTKGPGLEMGRRLFLQVVDSKIILKKEKTFEAPVRCMALFDHTFLVTIFGNTMVVEEYEPENSKWANRATTKLPSEGIHLSILRPFIYVSTGNDSHLCYELKFLNTEGRDELRFERVFTDSRQRALSHHIAVPFDPPVVTPEQEWSPSMDIDATGTNSPSQTTTLVLLADKTCTITGLLHPSHRTHRSDTQTVFEAHLPRSVTRFQRGEIRPPWRRPIDGPSAGILVDDIIGTCADGALYSFSIISDPALKLLKFIQNLIELKEARLPSNQHSIIHQPRPPVLNTLLRGDSSGGESSIQHPTIKVRDVDPDEGKPAPKLWHVNADIIVRFFEDAHSSMSANNIDTLLHLISNDAESDVAERFARLASGVGLEIEHDSDREDLLRKVMRWVHDVTMDLL